MKPPTVIIDIDGCVIEHQGKGAREQWFGRQTLIQGVAEQLDRLEAAGACIILITARKEVMRERLVTTLKELCIHYDQLIMGVTSGTRYMINDRKDHNPDSITSIGYSINRNEVGALKITVDDILGVTEQ